MRCFRHQVLLRGCGSLTLASVNSRWYIPVFNPAQLLEFVCQPLVRQFGRGPVRANGLLPSYLDASFDQLTATLRSGLPEVRNEEGAHGQGATPRETPNYVAAYALYLAAANILFLAEAHKAKG